jgi:hypothetical protein
MTFLEAARTVLAEARRPMTTREITDEALRQGLIETAGKTPEKSMDAQLYVRAKQPGATIVRLAEPGTIRARRGSVRWTLTSR